MKIFLLRHATPNLERKDIPYDILPGPELSPKGVVEAHRLGDFLKLEGLQKLYSSPFERAAFTARIIADINGIPFIEEPRLVEWRMVDEPEANVRKRMISIFQQSVEESAEFGPVGLVSHGGPLALLLLELGFPREKLAPYRKMFDTTNPLPPAGAWKIEQGIGVAWNFELAFTPK